MAAVSIGTIGAGYTSGGTVGVAARGRHRNKVDAPPATTYLKRVSVVYASPTTGTDGRPTGNRLTPTSETIANWGRLLVYINGRDLTYFRNVPTAITSLSWQRFGNYEACELRIDGATQLDTVGSGALSWLKKDSAVRIERQEPDGTRSTIWLGYLNAIRPMDTGTGLMLSAHGILLDGTYRVAMPPVRSKQTEARADAGHRIASALNRNRGRWGYCRPRTIGVDTTKRGQGEDLTSYVRSLLNLAIDDDGTGWTVWVDEDGQPSITKVSSIPGRQTHTIIAGQDGVQDALSQDTAAGITAIYGKGTTVGGASWRNTLYPMSNASNPRYPLDDPDALMGLDLKDAGTVPGTGVSTLQTKLNALGQDCTVNGIYDEATARAVANMQKKYGMKVNGIADIKLWGKLWKQRDAGRGAWVTPLAITDETRERNWNAYGKDTGRNPAYKPRARKLERWIEFADGVTLAQAKRVAAAILVRDGSPPTEGTVRLTVCPQERARWSIAPGDNLVIRGRWGASSIALIVHRVEWSLTDTPSVSLTVSTRDMDYGLLAAEMNRQPKQVVSTYSRYPSITQGTTDGANATPTPTAPALISKVRTLTANRTLKASDVDALFLLDTSAAAFEVRFPANADAEIPIGSQVHFFWTAGASTNAPVLAGVSPVVVQSVNGRKFTAQWAPATAVKIDTNTWVISGAMTAV